MACDCKHRTVIDFMATKKVKAVNPVIASLLNALGELDKVEAANSSDQNMLNAIRGKIEATAEYVNARMPETKPINEVKDNG